MSGESLTFKGYFRSIQDGEAVKALVANRPANDLFQNQLYLKNLLESIEAGRALILRDQTIQANLALGTPVYMDSSYVWRPAQANLANDPNSTLFMLTETAYVAGVVNSKASSTLADIAIAGQAIFDSGILDLIEGAYSEGIYYLSPNYPGKITASKGVAPVRVGMLNGPDASGDYSFILNPDPRVQLESHGHYRMILEDAPAGDPNCVPGKSGFLWGELDVDGPYPGIIHTVVNADSSLQGWLPADDPSFDGMNVPAGAKFGYNIQADPALLEIWPPMPVDQVYIEVDGVGETDDLVVVNMDGIWWMDDEYGKAPWPVNLPCTESSSIPESSSSTAYPIWPIRIEMWFTRAVHGTTIEAMNNQIALTVGTQDGIEPIDVGVDVEFQYLTNGLGVYAFDGNTGDSSSSSSGLGSATLVYKLVARDFARLGRTLTVRFEAVLGCPSTAVSATIQDIINSFSIATTTMPAAGTSIKDDSGIVTAASAWDITPGDLVTVPAGQYFAVRSEEVEVNANEVINVMLSFNSAFIGGTGDSIYLYAFRPIVELT